MKRVLEGGLVVFSRRVHVVDDEAAAFEHGLVLGFDGLGSLFDGFEFYVSESTFKLAIVQKSCANSA